MKNEQLNLKNMKSLLSIFKDLEKTNYKNASGNKTGSALNRKYAGAA